jgi:predicted DsbA family dithiol-disulfide isomerase
VNVEIWSDIACPWCYVGKRRFETALASFDRRDEVEIAWRSFELDPDAPPERPGSHAEHVAAKYGRTVEQVEAMHAEMTRTAAAEGVPFRFDLVRGGSTFDAHRVLQLAAAVGLQDEAKERLLRARHAEGELLSDHETLTRLGTEIGLPERALTETLATDRFADTVREDERTAAALDIHAVPCFVVDRRMAVSGAQQPALFLKMLERGMAARGANIGA